ncbi:Ig-like domain repeat protein [Streptomyces sp. S.PNR 29]|uniref:Ig-like domain repeat protein n=1 Tax=Streptomyces sp. S.PNR 29 TaxID=2973805 RepID=UPI0025B11A81|nr:Ig-like domain repeat protein [Streptomyces sp. S.PNR 29]MDN0199930.1 Ig-like domain repeat protein [Streptomyces sp. S.PNR 29]
MSVDLLPPARAMSVTIPAAPIATIQVGDDPTGVAIARVGRAGYVTNFGSGTVTALDTVTRSAIATVTVGSGPWGVAVDPTGAEAYVGNSGSGTVSVIATATNAVTATIGGISAPAGIAFSPDGTRAYVVSQDTGSLVVLDTATRAVVASVAVGGTPYEVALSPDAPYAYVSDLGNGTVTVVDTATHTAVATIGGFAQPRGLALTPDGQRLYVADHGGGTVGVVDTTTYAVATTIGGFNGPLSLAIGPRGALAYVTESGSGSLTAINLATNARAATVTGLGEPKGLGVTRDSRHIYVADSGTDTVRVLNIPVAVSPEQGHIGGGTPVTLSGRGFLGVTGVRFAGRPAASFSVVDDFTIAAVTPAGMGVAPVTVTLAGVAYTVGKFFYLESPRIRAVSPSTGPNAGGNTLTVTGTGLYTTQEVRFGTTGVYPTVVSDGQLILTAPPAPPAPPGPAIRTPVVVTTLGGTAGGPAYTYRDPLTTITLSSSAELPVVGEQVTFTATVGAVPAEAGTPTGTVWFYFGDGTVPVTAVVVDGLATATHSYSTTSGSPYTVIAAYSGDDDFAPSSDTAEQAVAMASTSTTVLSSPEPSNPGGSTTVTTRVIVAAPGAGQPTGTVTVDFGDGTPSAVQMLVDGLATVTHTYPATEATYTITAAYSGDTNHAPSGGVRTHRVLSDVEATLTTVTSAPDPSTAWQPVAFTATVASTAPGGGTPTGTVTFDFGDGTPTVQVPLSDGNAAVSHTYTSVVGSPYPVVAVYTSDDEAISASAGQNLQTVNPAPTSTTLSASPEPSVAGQPVTFTATVAADAAEAGIPTGTVVFDFGDGSPPAAAPVDSGTAAIVHTYATTTGSPYTVTATYGGDNFAGSTATATHTVGQASTSIAVASVPNPSHVGAPVTFTVTVTPQGPGAGIPTGTVTCDFGDGTAPVTLPLTDASATTSHIYTHAADIPYPLTVTYGGDANFTGSTATGTHRVNRALTLTTVTAAPDPSVVGETVTFTAAVVAVAPGAGTPTGSVVFDFGDGTAPVTTPLTNGIATATHAYTARTGSPYTATATYSGDTDFVSSSGAGLHTVGRASTTTTLSSSPDPSVVGQPVTFTATVAPVAPGAGAPAGSVVFDFGDGSTPVTASLTNGIATATHVYTARTGSPYTATATYNGDTDFVRSTGVDSHTVGRASTTTTVSSSPDPSVVGQPVTFTATVAPVAPGAGTPTGSVVFDFGDGSTPVTATLSNGVATVTRPYTARTGSPYTVTVTYSGDTDFVGSTGVDSHTVGQASTTTTVSSSPDPSVVGQPVTFTATVASVAPGAGTPTGTVTFDFGDGTTAVTATLSNGVATVTRPYTTRSSGLFTVTATYNGSNSFAGSSGSDSHVVNRALSATTVVSSPDPSAPGQTFTITATVTAVPPGAGTPTGSVTFTIDSRPPISAPLVNGTAGISTRLQGVGNHSITAAYTASADFDASSGTDTHTVRP